MVEHSRQLVGINVKPFWIAGGLILMAGAGHLRVIGLGWGSGTAWTTTGEFLLPRTPEKKTRVLGIFRPQMPVEGVFHNAINEWIELNEIVSHAKI